MASRSLRVIAGGPRVSGEARWLPPSIGALLLSLAMVATWLGADDARRTIDVREMANSAMETALRQGADDRQVRQTLTSLRDVIGWRPLESKTRVVYASLLLGLATDTEQMQLAAFHARRAATLSPVTVSVVRAAALVLANTGNVDEATRLVREMFLFDAPKAATTLAQIDSLVLGVETREGVPDDPDAWLAWSAELRRKGLGDEAASWLADAMRRWPDHLQLRLQLSYEHYGRGDWSALEATLPDDVRWPRLAASATLYAFRALVRQRGGDEEGALRDMETALSIKDGRGVHVLAGDLFERLEDPERARAEWTTALFLERDAGSRLGLLQRLARLEDRWGRPAAALDYWRQVAAGQPEHLEARRRIEDLTGFAP